MLRPVPASAPQWHEAKSSICSRPSRLHANCRAGQVSRYANRRLNCHLEQNSQGPGRGRCPGDDRQL
eukprot:1936556-Pleurochrysis_carterae.AAC.1